MDDTIRCDLSGYDKDYVLEVLDGFLDGAHRHNRMVVQIQTSPQMVERLEIDSYRDVPIIVNEAEFEGTIEVVFEKLTWGERWRRTLGKFMTRH